MNKLCCFLIATLLITKVCAQNQLSKEDITEKSASP